MRKSTMAILILLGVGVTAAFFTNMDYLNPTGSAWPEKETEKVGPEPLPLADGPQPTVTLKKVHHKGQQDGKIARPTTAKTSPEGVGQPVSE